MLRGLLYKALWIVLLVRDVILRLILRKTIGYFSYHGVIISKYDSCFGGGGVCRWRISCR